LKYRHSHVLSGKLVEAIMLSYLKHIPSVEFKFGKGILRYSNLDKYSFVRNSGEAASH
jgi:hypothetical protein